MVLTKKQKDILEKACKRSSPMVVRKQLLNAFGSGYLTDGVEPMEREDDVQWDLLFRPDWDDYGGYNTDSVPSGIRTEDFPGRLYDCKNELSEVKKELRDARIDNLRRNELYRNLRRRNREILRQVNVLERERERNVRRAGWIGRVPSITDPREQRSINLPPTPGELVGRSVVIMEIVEGIDHPVEPEGIVREYNDDQGTHRVEYDGGHSRWYNLQQLSNLGMAWDADTDDSSE